VTAAAFAMVANTPGVFLVAGWSAARAPRMIGLYLMLGTFGSALGPPIAQALISSAFGWRGFWTVMAGVAAIIAVICAVAVREPPETARQGSGGSGSGPGLGAMLASPRFLVLAAAMVFTQLCVMTISSTAPAHLVARGWDGDLAASLLGIQGLIGALGIGVSGFLTQRLSPRLILAVSLVMTTAGMLLIAGAQDLWELYLFAPLFGIGWSVTTLAIAVLLVEYFGNAGGSTALAAIWMATGASAVGPWLAGVMADNGWGFSPALGAFGILLLPIAVAVLLIGRPQPIAEPA